MTKKEMVDHNIGLTFDFLREIVRNPKLLRRIKNGSTLKFVQKDLPLPEKKNGHAKSSYVKVNHTFEVL
jgi:hypothetical protein